MEKMLRIKQVCDVIGMGRTWVYMEMDKGKFPLPYSLGGEGSRACAWKESEIQDWMDSLLKIDAVYDRVVKKFSKDENNEHL